MDKVSMSKPVEVGGGIPVKQMEPSSTVTPPTLSTMGKIIDALSHEDAIKIFIYAQDGISNSSMAVRKLGLTQKRYYTRMRRLQDAGLIEKRGGSYQYTFLGTILYQMVESFKTIIERKDRLELANRLRKTEILSLKEKEDLMSLITPYKLGEISNLSDIISPVRVVENYEDLVKNLVDVIEKVEESIYLVSKYNDIRVIEAMSRALKRGIKIRVLSEKNGLIGRVNMLKAFLSPRMLNVILEVAKGFSDMVRKTNIYYSFVILDNKLVVIEVPHPTKDTFYLGFIFQNVDISRRLISIFNEMWAEADKVSLL